MNTSGKAAAGRLVLENAALAAVYYGGARLGQLLALAPSNITPVWIPSGVILAAVLLRGWRLWPGVLLGAAAGNVWAYLDLSAPLQAAASLLCGLAHGCGDVLFVAYASQRLQRAAARGQLFQGTANVLRFLAHGALIGPGLSALTGAAAHVAGGLAPWASFGPSLLIQWAGGAFGVLIFTPPLVAWVYRRDPPPRLLELAAFAAALGLALTLGLNIVPFQGPVQAGMMAVVPILIWGVFRLSQHVVYTGICLTAVAAISATVRNYGPFAGASLMGTLIELQSFLAMITVTLLVLDGVLTDWRRTEQALRRSEERFALAVRGTDAGVWDWDLQSNSVYYSPRWKSMLGYGEQQIGPWLEEWEERIHPDDRQRVMDALQAYLEGRLDDFEVEHRLRHRDGSYRWMLARGAAVRDAAGRPTRMVGSHLDITALRRSEEALRAQEVQLLAAQRIQERLRPQQPPDLPGYDIQGATYPAEFAAGDHFDYFLLPDASLAVLIGDVSGHGFSSALLMASTCAHLRSLAETGLDVGQILTRANTALGKETAEGSFVSLLLVRVYPKTGVLTYVNAGHPAGYVLDAEGRVKERLASSAVPLGVLPDAAFPVGGPLQLDPGDMLLLVTDGLLEASDPDTGDLYGMDRVLAIVRQLREASARSIVEALHDDVARFAKRSSLEDDATIVVVRRERTPHASS